MASLASRFEEVRASRDVAKAQFDARYASIKADYEERGILGRMADEAIDKAIDTFDEAAAVVEEHPVVIGGTIVAILLWIFRNPIMAGASELFKSRE